MRQIRTSGSTSGRWKRGRVQLVRHRQTKEPATDRLHLNHRATSRLYPLPDSFALRGQGELLVATDPATVLRVAFVNTPQKQRLELTPVRPGVSLISLQRIAFCQRGVGGLR